MSPIKAYKATVIAIALVGATLLAVPQASAFSITSIAPYALLAQTSGGVLMDQDSVNGLSISSATLAPGTSPAAAPIPNGYVSVWQGANNDLWTSAYGTTDLGFVKMAPGTSPSLASFPDGDWVAAYHGANGVLYLNGSWGLLNRGYTLAPGTSPSVAGTPLLDALGRPTDPDHYTMAWQGSNGHLWIWGPPTNPIDTGLAMAPGTSPSITRQLNTPQVQSAGNYTVAFQGADGNLWSDASGTGATSHDWLLPMAPGTSPSIGTQFVAQAGYYPTAFQGRNGDLWVQEAGGDTGQPMMAGTSPRLMITPVDEPGAPLGGLAAYVGFTSNTGTVSLYGENYNDTSPFTLPTILTAAAGTSPAIVSALNEADGGWVTGNAVHAAAKGSATASAAAPAPAPAAVGSTAVPLKLPSKPTITPMTVQPAISDTCPAVRAQAKQYAARGMKTASCVTITKASPPTPVHAGPQAVTPNATTDSTCGVGTWVITRTEECIQSESVVWTEMLVPSEEVVGNADFLFNQDVTMQTNSTLFVENDSINFSGGWGAGLTAGAVTWTAACSSPCHVLDGATRTFTIAPRTTQGNINITYGDSPGTQTPDTMAVSYSMLLDQPGYPPTGPDNWSLPRTIRCDDQFPGNMGAGCVVPSYGPVLPLSVSVYGAAAVNVYIGENFLPGTPGLSEATPLTRGDPAQTDPNRAKVCNTFQPFLTLVPQDSCDEYPFASSQQSGGALGLTGADCLEALPLQLANGTWSYSFLNKYTHAYPQLCEVGHVNQTLNSAVGSQALNPMYTANRMLIGDPYAVEVIN